MDNIDKELEKCTYVPFEKIVHNIETFSYVCQKSKEIYLTIRQFKKNVKCAKNSVRMEHKLGTDIH